MQNIQFGPADVHTYTQREKKQLHFGNGFVLIFGVIAFAWRDIKTTKYKFHFTFHFYFLSVWIDLLLNTANNFVNAHIGSALLKF